MSDTPQTDAAQIRSVDDPTLKLGIVDVGFARDMERAIDRLEKERDALERRVAVLESELQITTSRAMRLEEAGDAMAETTTTPDAIAWKRAKEARP